jgi:hypothetical protein
MIQRLIDWLIARAKRTPYMHLDGYMERFWLFRIWREGENAKLAGKIHHILRSDAGRDFHDHPWPYLTIILRGGYYEWRPIFDKSGLYKGEKCRWYGPGSIIFRPARSWHRLELDRWLVLENGKVVTQDKTAWTLFITGPKSNSWGFLVEPRHKVYYRDYHTIFPAYVEGMRADFRGDGPVRNPVFSGEPDPQIEKLVNAFGMTLKGKQ